MRSYARPARAACAAVAAAALPPSRSSGASHGRGMMDEKLPVRYLWVLAGSTAEDGRAPDMRRQGRTDAGADASCRHAARPHAPPGRWGATRQGSLPGNAGGAAARPGRQAYALARPRAPAPTPAPRGGSRRNRAAPARGRLPSPGMRAGSRTGSRVCARALRAIYTRTPRGTR